MPENVSKEGDQGRSNYFNGNGRNYHLRFWGSIFLGALSLLVVAKIFTEVRTFQFIGQSPTTQEATIVVSGDAETFIPPDIAELTFSVSHESKKLKEAQDKVTAGKNAILKFLTDQGVEEKDIRTTDYSFYPEYDYVSDRMICAEGYCPPVNGRQVLRGYRVSETVSIKIRDIDKAGEILGGLAEHGATNVSGLAFRVEDEETVIEGLRKEAIEEAQAKAKRLARDLGVEILRVQGFSEDGYFPIYGRGAALKTMEQDMAMAPSVSPGEQKLMSNVTITYVVR